MKHKEIWISEDWYRKLSRYHKFLFWLRVTLTNTIVYWLEMKPLSDINKQ